MINIIAGGTPLAHRLHADVSQWYTRFRTAGGRVSRKATLQGFDAFANAIETDGIRDRFYRINAWVGDDLTTALVPFYLGPVTGGTEHGNAADQNVGPFISSDWAENVGLRTNGGSKHLLTGLTPTVVGSAAGHCSVDRMGAGTGLAICARTNIDVAQLHQIEITTGPASVGAWGATTTASGAGDHVALITATRTAGNSLKVYSAGTEVGSSAATPTLGGANNTPFTPFARNIDGAFGSRYTGVLGGYTIGLALDATQAAALNTAWAALRTALGR